MTKKRLIIGLSALFCAAGDAYSNASGLLHSQFRWPKGATIPVCFENPTSGNLAGRTMVEYAAEKSWETIADVNFAFSTSACGSTVNGIRIKITDDSKVKACGENQPHPGRPHTCYKWDANGAQWAKMHLNFTFENFKGAMSPVATDPAIRQKQINRMIFHYAIHEFGHAIGFLHETDRLGGKKDAGAFFCDDDDGENSIGGVEVAYYDAQSVMHYRCNNAGSWPNGPPTALSCGDMIAARWMFGDKNTNINPLCVAAKAFDKSLPETIQGGYNIPHGSYDLGSGANVYEPTTTPVFSPISTNNWGPSAPHLTPNRQGYNPLQEPKISMAIYPEFRTIEGLPQEGYLVTVNFHPPSTPYYGWEVHQVWLQDLTLQTAAGPITNYWSNSNPRDNKPDWAYPQPGGVGAYYCVRTLPAAVRDASIDKRAEIVTPKLSTSNRSWSMWVPKGQEAFRDVQNNYWGLFSSPLPGVRAQSANESGLYSADMRFYSINARIAYWDGAWYESINIKGALPMSSNAVKFFIDKNQIVSQSVKMGNPHTPSTFLQVDKTEITFADYFFITSNRTPYSMTFLDPKQARNPVTSVTWYDAIIYCNLRSELEGLEKVYSYSNATHASGPDEFRGHCVGMLNLSADLKKNGYRLPTEAEWKDLYSRPASEEYYWPSQDNAQDYAWFGNGLTAPMPVGTKRPNSRGLYDLSGNAAEYVWGGVSGSWVVAKGGSVTSTLADLGKSGRLDLAKYDPSPAASLRVVRTRPNPLIPIRFLLID